MDTEKELQLKSDIQTYQEIAQQEIKTQVGYENASNVIKDCKRMLVEIGEAFDPMIESAHKLHKQAISQKSLYADPVKEVETILRRKLSAYISQQEAIKEAERKEKQRLIDLEARAKKEAEEKRLLEEARAMEIIGLKEEAEEKIIEAVKVEEVKEIIRAEKVDTGAMSYRENWKYEIIGELPKEYLIPDEKKIGQIVRAMKGETNITGVRVWCEKSAVVR